MKKISVITVVYNDSKGLEYTIQSVLSQTYNSIEYIVIDGGSNDGTLDIIKKYESQIDIWKSEPDEGIFDAMNKGARLASGEWLNFMNAGDRFVDNNVLERIFSIQIPESISFIYSDCNLYLNNQKLYTLECSVNKGVIQHQSSIYRRSLHQEYGYYISYCKKIVSDYLFFNQIPINQYFKTDVIISDYDFGGFSQANWCYLQKICCDYIFGRISVNKLLALIIKFKIKRSFPKPIRKGIKTIFHIK